MCQAMRTDWGFPADRVAACQAREIEVIPVRNGGKKSLRLKLNCSQPDLCNQASETRV
jgi:hypothetical protein